MEVRVPARGRRYGGDRSGEPRPAGSLSVRRHLACADGRVRAFRSKFQVRAGLRAGGGELRAAAPVSQHVSSLE